MVWVSTLIVTGVPSLPPANVAEPYTGLVWGLEIPSSILELLSELWLLPTAETGSKIGYMILLSQMRECS